ncbi:type II CRISPR RNA-guided endonuclease Cas9 [Holzapfeliella floricola]|uniref:type II CRISPR RNA-guided endonuclease Cas9 n=1 Tax=Holzapfeliella floricola TaxID=679249 RepID=UPI0034E25B21
MGLDIGVGSVGWTITDSQSQKVLKVKGKQGIGVHLFNEGQTAEERRQFRTNRRRLKRRKWRLRLLRELFDEPISSIDPEFFARLKYFNESSKDPKNKGYQPQLHDDLKDVDFYRQYPTIYHLRHALMTQKEKFDIRDIYLAIHHIVKYRGHFLMNGHSSSFSVAQTDWKADLTKLFELIQETRTNLDFSFDLTEIDTIKSLLFDKNLSRNDRQKEIVGLINNNSQLDKKR